MTYCGESKASNLTMQNIPWHEEILSFVQNLVDLLPDYELACEHEHSNCVLLANKKVSLFYLIVSNNNKLSLFSFSEVHLWLLPTLLITFSIVACELKF